MVEFSPFFFQTEKLSHADLDERALDALKEFPVEVREENVKNPATLLSYSYTPL